MAGHSSLSVLLLCRTLSFVIPLKFIDAESTCEQRNVRCRFTRILKPRDKGVRDSALAKYKKFPTALFTARTKSTEFDAAFSRVVCFFFKTRTEKKRQREIDGAAEHTSEGEGTSRSRAFFMEHCQLWLMSEKTTGAQPRRQIKKRTKRIYTTFFLSLALSAFFPPLQFT